MLRLGSRLVMLAASGLLASACGGSAGPAAPRAAVAKAAEKPMPPPTARPPHVLYRDEVQRVVADGLGAFLQHVELEPALEDGRFVGHRIVSLVPPEFWRGVDLQAGDVVQQVNGMPIERDIEAYRAFVALKSAAALKVTYLRNGAPRELAFEIVPRP